MVLDRDCDDAVSGAARPRLSLTGEAHLRSRLDPGGQFGVDRRPVGERDALRRLRRGVDEGYRQAISDIGAFLRSGAAPSEPAARPGAAAPAEPHGRVAGGAREHTDVILKSTPASLQKKHTTRHY